jgi:dihydroorotate dehydrogenase electron transfer subunit
VSGRPRCWSLVGRVTARQEVSSAYLVTALELPEAVSFLPGQFAMLNFPGPRGLTFGRPFSILSASGSQVSFLYRVVGRGTAMLAEAPAGTEVTFLGPLGQPFPPPADAGPFLLLAGGVGLPPLHAWRERYGRPGDLCFFGARDGKEVPWRLVCDHWSVSVDAAMGLPEGREAFTGNVVEACRSRLLSAGGKRPAALRPARVLACGPRPMLVAAASFCHEQGWPCLVSVEERMGCGFGVCRGCVVPTVSGHHVTVCQDGPVLPAERIDWQRFGAREEPAPTVAEPRP